MVEEIDCPLCGMMVRQVSSATLSLALWQHVNWACPKKGVEVTVNARQINRAQEERVTEVRKWMVADGPCSVWPPYPIVSDREGNLFRLYIGAAVPEGWLIVGLNCERSKDVPFVGERRKDPSRP